MSAHLDQEDADRAMREVAAEVAAELAGRRLTREQQREVDKADRIMRRLDHLERNRREGRT
jgi:hypothetical protein